MGCFSFICQGCKTGVNSETFSGERVHLWLLKDGKPIEHMEGQYDSYGRVIDDDGNDIEWSMPWHDVCELMHNVKKDDGIAAIHSACFDGNVPTVQSEGDPEQGWNPLRKRHC